MLGWARKAQPGSKARAGSRAPLDSKSSTSFRVSACLIVASDDSPAIFEISNLFCLSRLQSRFIKRTIISEVYIRLLSWFSRLFYIQTTFSCIFNEAWSIAFYFYVVIICYHKIAAYRGFYFKILNRLPSNRCFFWVRTCDKVQSALRTITIFITNTDCNLENHRFVLKENSLSVTR